MARGATIRMRKRSLFMAVLIAFLGFSILIYRLFNLQVVQGKFLDQMALDQQLANTKLVARRGTIYDRLMNPLAQSATVWNVVLEPPSIKDDQKRELICAGLHEILGIEIEKLKKLSLKKTFYNIVKKKINCDERNKIIEFKNKNKITAGIRLIEDNKRFYPYGAFAANLIGFVGSDGQGLAGIESYYEKYLKGEDGKILNAKNAIGMDMPSKYEQMISPKEGNNLKLTIDSTIQKIVEKHLSEGIKINNVQNRGVAIAMDVTNGEILAMAVKEDFDPNEPFKIVNESDINFINTLPENERIKAKSEILSKQWRNKAVSDTYYPGSVFKMVVASMAMELGITNESSNFTCGGGIKISERSQYIKCHKRGGHGSQNFTQALCHSCNPAFITIGQQIGDKNFLKFYNDFGFHEKTKIDLPGEASDLFFHKMRPIDLAVASIGQNFGITPIQMITAACVIANGGTLIRPHVVKEILDKDGNIVKSFQKEERRKVISKDVALRVSKMMEQNAIDGGAKNAYVAGFRVAGKTGTSEKIGLSTPGYKDYISSFCGYAPADDPKIAILVFLDTPRGDQYYGSLIAAPIFANIMADVLPYMGIEEIYNDIEMKKYGVLVPDFLSKKINEARMIAINEGFKPMIVGQGEHVTFQMPCFDERIPKGSTIILYTENSNAEKLKVPDFKNLSISEAKELATNSKFNIKISGCTDEKFNPISISQSISPGEFINVGSVIDVKFISKEQIEE